MHGAIAPPDGPPAHSDNVLVGREPTLIQLRELFDSSRSAVGAVIWGEAGIGKTSVLDALLEAAPETAHLHREAARPLQEDVPYALVADLFELTPQATDPLRAALGRLLISDDADSTRSVDPYARVLGVTEGIVDVLQMEAAGSVTGFVVDDLHWADRPSLLVLDRLLRRAPEQGFRVVLASRPTTRLEVQAVADRVASAGGTQFTLEPLAEEDGLEMLAAALGAVPGPNLRTLARGAAGNPLYLAELGRAVLDGGGLLRTGDVVDLPRSDVPSSFHLAVLQRLDGLPSTTVRMLQVSAILGIAIDIQVVAAISGSDTFQVLGALQPASVSGLLVERAGGLCFRHELVRNALDQGMPDSARREYHRVAARTLADTDRGAVAAHLEAAGAPFSSADLQLLRAAADAAARVDGRRAVALLDLVLENTAQDAADRVEVRAQRAEALVMSGDLDGAAEALSALERDGFGTNIGVGRAMLEAQGARDQPDPALVARLYVQAGQIEDEADQLDAMGVIAYHAVRADATGFDEMLAELPEDGAHLPLDARVHFLLARALQRGTEGDLFGAIEAARAAYQLARDEGASPQAAVRAGLALGVFGGDLEPFRADAIAALQDATRWAEDSHQAGMIAIAHALLANAYWARGDWDEAEASYRTAAVAADEADVPRWKAEALFLLSAIAADRGDIEAARAYSVAWQEVGWGVDTNGGSGGAGGAGRGWMRPMALQARIAFGAGQDREAISFWRADARDPQTVPFGKAISGMDLAVAALGAGDRAALESAADALRPLESAGPPVSMVRPLVLAALEGNVDAAVAVAEEARITPVYGFAKMAEVAGLVARDAGDRETAVRWLGEAVRAWEACGALALQRRTAATLRALGVRTRGRIRGRPATGWDSLSDAERHVVAEAANGLLYREIAERLHLSRRTIETHVASAIRKLDLRNRGELAAEYWKRHG